MMLIIVDVGDRKDLLNEMVVEGVASNPHDFIGKCHHSSCCTHNILMSLFCNNNNNIFFYCPKHCFRLIEGQQSAGVGVKISWVKQ